MRILQVVNTLSGGGAESFVTDLSIELNRIPGNEVFVLVYGGVIDKKGELLRKMLIENDVRFYDLNIHKNMFKIFIPIFLIKTIKKIKPQIVHSHLDQSDFFIALSKLLNRVLLNNKIKYVRTLHNNCLISTIPEKVHGWIFNKFDKTFSCSQSVKDNFQLKKYRNQIISVPNGINLKHNYEFVEKITFKSDYFNLLSIGSFSTRLGILQKGQDVLLNAISKLIDIKIKVHFLGDGSQISEMKKLASILKIEDKCEFYGQVTNVNTYILASDCLCFPSRFEGLPIAAIEGVILSKPLIVSDIPAFEPFEKSSKLVFENGSSEKLAETIIFAITNKETLINNAKYNAYIHQERFNIEKVANIYMSYYAI